jgi:succinate dehydrogenase / fumarate reductase flavoprotein subunit/fumarate reductase (CoM/CoB) subunit A
MGGVKVDETMQTGVAGLYAAGEAVGGASGANRLSGNAITEALVFGERAGRFAARCAQTSPGGFADRDAAAAIGDIARLAEPGGENVAFGPLFAELQDLMWEKVGLLRNGDALNQALTRIRTMRAQDLPRLRPRDNGGFALGVQEWFDLRAGLVTAEAVTLCALSRTESRGAHQREDRPETDPAQAHSQHLRLLDGALVVDAAPVRRVARA